MLKMMSTFLDARIISEKLPDVQDTIMGESMESDLRSICDLEMEQPVLPVFPDSSKPCVEVWNEKLKKGVLSCTHFKEHWRIWVPKIYSPEPNGSCLDWSFDETKAQDVLFDTLERFICNGDPQEVLIKLSQMDSPPSVCGRVFKMGEPTYSCRECGMDSTCVLCVDCFKQSAHRHHKYKMVSCTGTSSGGGCCDCGDTEAWRTEPFCDIHALGSENRPDSAASHLPDDLEDRARATFTAVLKYAYQLLTLEYSPGLPSDLRVKESEDDPLGFLDTPDTYCTVLFNDETHTFEQVISTLARVIKCSQRDAIEFVTNIDREGRAVVKCSTFQHCNELKTDIERFTARHGNRPLKVLVVHAHVVAHQFFAMKLLDWLQKILGYAEGFRVLFSEVALQTKSPDASIVEGILLRDSHLWKSARTHWHRLIISGMLMEYDSKKAFAKVFTKNYGSVVKDFIRDDHDHSFSIASMSVQVFTVPTLAHHLIANEEVLFVLLHTFISECTRKCNKAGKLEFERNVPIGTFKRAQYILYDLRYLLSAKPTTWTDGLRKGFLQGISLLLNLLTFMQGMDLVTRQVGQHMEYEPEWESAFNLHIKLAHVITLALEWCGTDRIVLIKAYRATLKKLYDNPSFDPAQAGEVRELADHSATCIQYDVATQPVSIHLPLSRFLAGLHLHLEKFGLSFDSHELQVTPRPSPEQLIEPVLRTQVMISQVHAGMWRRNGYSLLNQLYFYHNVKCRSEMLDRDIVLLQVGASLIESNEFLIHLLNKFNLMNWANQQFELNTLKNPEEDSMRQTISLVEEFLGLLVVLVGERYTPGVGKITPDDRIKKELIQQLCIKPLPHSELNKTLPEDVNHETGMERVIDQVAEFKKPGQGSGKGVYELKRDLYSEYNVFFYHYTREELSKSEETQRKRRKTAGEIECCPPPLLPPLTDAFMMMANLLQCDVMLHIMQVVLERSLNLRARSFSETQLHKVLHLIGYALQEEEKQYCQFLLFTERAEKWRIEQLIEELCTSPRVEAHKDLLAWTLTKYRQVAAPRRQNSLANTISSSTLPETSTQSDDTAKEKEWRAKMAAQKRAKIMAQMTAMQKNFMKENAKLFETTITDTGKSGDLRGSSMDLSECVQTSPVALGINQTTKVTLERSYTCILCQEDQNVSVDGPALVLAGFVQQSTVLCQRRKTENLDMEESGDDIPDPLFLPAALGPAPHTGTCGHVMHSHCWQKYFDNVLAKENRRPYRLRQPASFDVEKHEFLCPLCECLSNTVLPLVPPLGILQQSQSSQLDRKSINFKTWLQGLQITLKYRKKLSNGIRNLEVRRSSPRIQAMQAAQENSSSSEQNVTDFQVGDGDGDSQPFQLLLYTCPIDQVSIELGDSGPDFAALFPTSRNLAEEPQLSDNLSEMILLYSQATYTKGLGVHPHLGDSRVPLMTWKSCAYTIHSLECLLRDMDKPLFGDLSCRQQDCLEGLIRIVGVLGTTWKRPEVISSHALRLLSMLLENSSDVPCILDWDCFGVLVPLTLSLPSLFLSDQPTPIPSGGVQELYVLRLVLLSHIVKILLTTDFNRGDVPMDVEEDGVEPVTENNILELLNTVRKVAGISTDDSMVQLDARGVWAQIKHACIPFLRCCALFYHFLTGVPAPNVLMEVGGDTFENLCAYLGLPNSCSELISSSVMTDLSLKWAQHDKVRQYTSGASSLAPIPLPLPVNQLVALPLDYSELINTVSLFTCPNSEREDSRNPTMCLVCGEMLCSQSYCCQTELNKSLVGACTYHAHECGAGVGIFLRVRECEVLLLASPNRGCFMSPPYLDQYGETDQGLRRGNPLRLCPERYKKLQLLWLGHGIHEEIARALESSSNLMSTQWQHL
ncbi:E3 ubiquitin-protein ligase UBR2 isoform X3 [Periplaneta americana]|uniref:E3 ubiquitin-protein ligase UBR2 isoform X3 n=1 Tax=Periplaneta americana TaxID=6978 RepID=UPI0037E92AD3